MNGHARVEIATTEDMKNAAAAVYGVIKVLAADNDFGPTTRYINKMADAKPSERPTSQP